ncbi:hypothetical protein BGW42_008357 [Actinomortierella wolfii]|nr:hypothetical protein BGW42_008357 [Actinomortierella wolfii]
MATPLLPGGHNAAPSDKPASTVVWIRRLLAILVVLGLLYQLQGYVILYRNQQQEVGDTLRDSVKGVLPPPTLSHDQQQDIPSDSNRDNDDKKQQPPKQLPRIFDIILLNNEMDQLEIRLGELHEVVDFFVIVESLKTFSRKDKPLYYRMHQHEERYARHKNKILHIVVPDMTEEQSQRMTRVGGYGWEYETFVRNKAIETLIDAFRPSEGDWLLLSDLDEIPKPAVLSKLKQDPDSISTNVLSQRDWQRHTAVMQRHHALSFVRLDCDFYYYSYEYKHRGQWIGPILARFEEPDVGVDPFLDDQNKLDKDGMVIFDKPFWNDYNNMGYRMRMMLRLDQDVATVDQSCWHCSWCFPNISDVQRKANSYSHREHADSQFMQHDWILEHFREGIDLFEREGEVYDYIKNNKDVPAYVATQRDRFAYQLNRKGKYNAGFVDVPAIPPAASTKQNTPADNVEEDQQA